VELSTIIRYHNRHLSVPKKVLQVHFANQSTSTLIGRTNCWWLDFRTVFRNKNRKINSIRNYLTKLSAIIQSIWRKEHEKTIVRRRTKFRDVNRYETLLMYCAPPSAILLPNRVIRCQSTIDLFISRSLPVSFRMNIVQRKDRQNSVLCFCSVNSL